MIIDNNTLLMLGIIALTDSITNNTIHTSYSKQEIIDALDETDMTIVSKDIRRLLYDEET